MNTKTTKQKQNMKSKTTKELLTTKELAAAIKVTPRTISNWVSEGRITPIKLGSGSMPPVRFEWDSVLKELKNPKVNPKSEKREPKESKRQPVMSGYKTMEDMLKDKYPKKWETYRLMGMFIDSRDLANYLGASVKHVECRLKFVKKMLSRTDDWVGLSNRSAAALDKSGLKTKNDLLYYVVSGHKIEDIKGLGAKSAKEVKDFYMGLYRNE